MQEGCVSVGDKRRSGFTKKGTATVFGERDVCVFMPWESLELFRFESVAPARARKSKAVPSMVAL